MDWFARTYGWTPLEVLAQPRHLLKGLRLLRGYRQAGGRNG